MEMKPRLPRLLPLALIILFWVVYFSKIIFFRQVFFIGDNFTVNLPLNLFFLHGLKQGEFPLWNPYILGGVPLFLPTNLLFFPTFFLFFLTQESVAISWTMILIFLLAGISMYLFSYSETGKPLSAFYSALVYMFSGFLAKTNSTYVTALSIAYFPLILFLMKKYLQGKRFVYLFLTSFVIFLDYASGHPLLLYLSLVALFLFTLSFKKASLVEKLVGFLLVLLFAAGLSAPLLLPQLELTGFSSRPINDYNYSTSSSLAPRYLPTMVVPHLFGIPEIEVAGNPGNILYLGILPLLLSALAIKYRVKPYRFFLFLTIAGLLLALGRHLPLYRLLLFLPGLKLFRQPSYFLLWYVFAVSFLSGSGFHLLSSRLGQFQKKINQKNPWFFRLVIIVTIICLTSFTVFTFLPSQFWLEITRIFPRFFLKSGKVRLLTLTVSQNLTFVLLIVSSFLLFLKKGAKVTVIFAVIFITFLDLFFLNQAELLTIDQNALKSIYSQTKIPPVLLDPNNRIASFYQEGSVNWNNFNRGKLLVERTKQAERLMTPNRNLFYGVNSAFGFSTLVSASYINFFETGEEKIIGLSGSDISLDNPRLAQAGACYLLTNRKQPLLRKPRYLLKSEGIDFFLYKDTLANKRVFLLSKDQKKVGQANITEETGNFLEIKTQSPVNTSLILLDNYFPGWFSYLDGHPVPILPYKETFRRVDLPPGDHLIEFVYEPQSFRWGINVFYFTVIVGLIFTFFIKGTRQRLDSKING